MEFINLKTQYAALQSRIAERIQRVLDHGQYIMGPEVAELEAALAVRTGARYCIIVSSGTKTLLISLRWSAPILGRLNLATLGCWKT